MDLVQTNHDNSVSGSRTAQTSHGAAEYLDSYKKVISLSS